MGKENCATSFRRMKAESGGSNQCERFSAKFEYYYKVLKYTHSALSEEFKTVLVQ